MIQIKLTTKIMRKKDNTTATGNIPQTGMNYTVMSIIALQVAIISIVSYKKYTTILRDVK